MRSTRRMKSNVTETRNVSLREMNRPMFERILNFSVILKVMVVIMSLNSSFVASSDISSLTECDSGKPADIIFVLDASNSIWSPDFQRQLNFVEEMVQAFRIGTQHTQVALITYADYPIVQFQLDYYVTKSEVLAAIAQIRQNGGYHTRTSEALRYMRERCFTKMAGARENVTRVGVIVTDGQSDEPELTFTEAVLAKEAGIHMFAIGVGSNPAREELNVIASSPTVYYTFTVENYKALTSIRNLLAIKACSVTDPPTTTQMTTTQTTTLQPPTTTKVLTATRSFTTPKSPTPRRRTTVKRPSASTRMLTNTPSSKAPNAAVVTDSTAVFKTNIVVNDGGDRRTAEQNLDHNQQITGVNGVTESMEGSQSHGIKVIIDEGSQTNGNVNSDWTYDDHLQKWIVKKARRDDIRQDSGFWSYNEAERLVWTPTEYHYQKRREDLETRDYIEGESVNSIDAHHNANRSPNSSRGCHTRTPLDIVFIIDSKIPTKSERKRMWELVRDVLSRIDISESRVRVQFVQSCTMFERSLALSDITNQTGILHAIDEITTLPRSTAELFESMTSKLMPERDGTFERKRIAIYLTDGPSGDLEHTIQAAQKSKNDNGIEIFAIAYGHIANPTELQAIVSCDISNHLYKIKNHSKSRVVHKKIAKYLCKV